MKLIIGIIIVSVFIYLRNIYRQAVNQEIINSNKKEINNRKIKNIAKRNSGKFRINGYSNLPEDTKKIIWKELKVGDELTLLLDPINEYDNKAIKVLFKETHIGWVPKDYYRKVELFDSLKRNDNIRIVCIENKRYQDYFRASKPDTNGNWNDKYLGMVQSVEVKFEYL